MSKVKLFLWECFFLPKTREKNSNFAFDSRLTLMAGEWNVASLLLRD